MESTSIHTVFFSGLFVLVALRVHSFTEQTKLVHYSGYIDNGGLKGHKKGTVADSYPFQFHLGARGEWVDQPNISAQFSPPCTTLSKPRD